MKHSLVLNFVASSLLVFSAGCVAKIPDQPDYVSGYSYVNSDPAVSADKDVGHAVLAPNACLAEAADIDPAAETKLTVVSGLGAHLPPGCANAYNLQRMVESERDLVAGRRMGPAAAAPVAKAARRYLETDSESAPAIDSTGDASVDTGP